MLYIAKSYNAEFFRSIGFYQPEDEAFIRKWSDKIQTIRPTEADDRFLIKDESKMSETGRKKRREARELINGTGSRFGVMPVGSSCCFLFRIHQSCSGDYDVLSISHAKKT